MTARRSKYNARRESFDGYSFDSQAEARRYRELLTLQLAGEIEGLAVHPRYTILDAFQDRDGRRQRAIVYEADFAYIQDGQRYVEDVKGVETDVFKIKRKLFLARYPELIFVVVKR